MKDYSYYIPGYTGFCPELREHFGQTYGHATRHILLKKPHLKERLAPVHYKYRRVEKVKGTLGKHHNHERDKYDYPKSKHHADIHDVYQAKHRIDYGAGDVGKVLYDLDYEDGDRCERKCCGDYESVRPRRVKYTSEYADCDKIRETDHEYVYPKYVFIKGFAECVPPERWPSEGRQKLPYEHYAATPYAHLRESTDNHFPPRISLAPKPHVHLKEYHPEDCGHKKDGKFGNERKTRKIPRVKPHRYGGVIPKYTGHVPGMLFSFGESYGPVSDRLLQKHHDRMRELKIKY